MYQSYTLHFLIELSYESCGGVRGQAICVRTNGTVTFTAGNLRLYSLKIVHLDEKK